ncbi:MAG: hypothetical protein M3N54_00035 [Acidobacteriota bacterium]|nr:hypothetical protein [Acidobacteriota bacterium]
MSDTRTRRDLMRLAATSGVLVVAAPPLFAASDFWNRKPSAEWSEDEAVQLKTKSPWAKKVRAEVTGGMGGGRGGAGGESMDSGGSPGSFGGMSGADSNGIGGGGSRGGGRGGGGGGGGRGSEGGVPSSSGIEVLVRWESARPLVEMSKLKLPPPFEGHYAVSVTGLSQQFLMMALTGRGGRGRAGNEAPPGEDPAARQKAAVDRLLHSATLSAKAKDPEVADLVVQTADKQSLIFGFSSHALPLAAGDKDLQFTMKLGAMTLKAKFDTKEMMYKGELAI